jgi:hypothetical protein
MLRRSMKNRLAFSFDMLSICCMCVLTTNSFIVMSTFSSKKNNALSKLRVVCFVSNSLFIAAVNSLLVISCILCTEALTIPSMKFVSEPNIMNDNISLVMSVFVQVIGIDILSGCKGASMRSLCVLMIIHL